VAILEDVVTTGGSTLKACAKAADAGLAVVTIVALVDRQEGGRENVEQAGYRLVALFGKKDFIPEGE